MFKLEYRIVLSDDDDFEGQNGFLQIKCNDYKYGEMYPKELETVMDKVSLFDCSVGDCNYGSSFYICYDNYVWNNTVNYAYDADAKGKQI